MAKKDRPMDFKKLKESRHIEFKSSFGKEVIISLSAFANTEGGKVIVGMDNNGKIVGTQVHKETEQRCINEIKQSTYPQIMPRVTVHEIKGKTLLVFEISEYPVKPVSYKNRYYKRVKNSNHMLSLDEIVNLQQESLNISFDAYPLKENLETLDTKLLEKFIEKINSRGRIRLQDDLLTNLNKMKLIQSGKPTLAAMLLFGNHGYSIHIGRFKAKDTIIDDLLIKEPLMTALDEAMVFIKKHINLSYAFDGSLERKETWQYPIEVLRELLLNAVVHRDYKHTTDIVIKIFDDHIVFVNPGTIYGNLTIEDLNRDDYVSSIRNKLLAEAFYLMGDIERYGTGFIRIRELLGKHKNTTCKIDEIGDFFRIQLLHTIVNDLKKNTNDLENDLKTVSNDLENDLKPGKSDLEKKYGLTANQAKILSEIMQDNNITQQKLSELVGITTKNIRNNIKKLKEKDLLQRIGPDKGGHWRVFLHSNKIH